MPPVDGAVQHILTGCISAGPCMAVSTYHCERTAANRCGLCCVGESLERMKLRTCTWTGAPCPTVSFIYTHVYKKRAPIRLKRRAECLRWKCYSTAAILVKVGGQVFNSGVRCVNEHAHPFCCQNDSVHAHVIQPEVACSMTRCSFMKWSSVLWIFNRW